MTSAFIWAVAIITLNITDTEPKEPKLKRQLRLSLKRKQGTDGTSLSLRCPSTWHRWWRKNRPKMCPVWIKNICRQWPNLSKQLLRATRERTHPTRWSWILRQPPKWRCVSTVPRPRPWWWAERSQAMLELITLFSIPSRRPSSTATTKPPVVIMLMSTKDVVRLVFPYYSIATRMRCQIKGWDGLQSIVCCHVTLQTDMQRTMVCRAGIPRVSRWPQVLFPLPQRHHLRSEGLCLQLVLQRGLRRVQGFLQPQRSDWRRTREGTRTVGRRPVASWYAASGQSESRVPATAHQTSGQGWSAVLILFATQRSAQRRRSSFQRYHQGRPANSELFAPQLKNPFECWYIERI